MTGLLSRIIFEAPAQNRIARYFAFAS